MTLKKHAAELHVLRLVVKGVNERKGVFSFVKVFAETLLLGILWNRAQGQ